MDVRRFGWGERTTGAVFTVELSTSEDLGAQISGGLTIESRDPQGAALLTGPDGKTLPGAEVKNIPLRQVGPGVYRSAPIVATTALPQPEEMVGGAGVGGGSSPRLTVLAQSVVNADGVQQGAVKVIVRDAQGAPVANAAPTITLMPEGTGTTIVRAKSLRKTSIDQPLLTDAAGRAVGFVRSNEPGMKWFTVSATMPGGGTGPSQTVRVLFIPDVTPVAAIPGGILVGFVKPGIMTRVGTDELKMEDGILVPRRRAWEAKVLSATISFKPQGEADFRPADFAIGKGLAPVFEINFTDALYFHQLCEFPTRCGPGTTLLDPSLDTLRVGLVVDDDLDETTADRSLDPRARFLIPREHPELFEWTPSNTLRYFPAGRSQSSSVPSPFTIGTNRLQLFAEGFDDRQRGLDLGASYGHSLRATPVTVAEMLLYTTTGNIVLPRRIARPDTVDAFVGEFPAGEFAAIPPHTRTEIDILFQEGMSDANISGALASEHLVPIGYLQDFKTVLASARLPYHYQSSHGPVNTVLAAESIAGVGGVRSAALNVLLDVQVAVPSQDGRIRKVVDPATGTVGTFGSHFINPFHAKPMDFEWPNFTMDTYAALRFAKAAARDTQADVVLAITDTGVGFKQGGAFMLPPDLAAVQFIDQSGVSPKGTSLHVVDVEPGHASIPIDVSLSDIHERDQASLCTFPDATRENGIAEPDGTFDDFDLHGQISTLCAVGDGSDTNLGLGIGSKLRFVNVVLQTDFPQSTIGGPTAFDLLAAMNLLSREPEVDVVNISFGTGINVPQSIPSDSVFKIRSRSVCMQFRNGTTTRTLSLSDQPAPVTLHAVQDFIRRSERYIFEQFHEQYAIAMKRLAAGDGTRGVKPKIVIQAAGNNAQDAGAINTFAAPAPDVGMRRVGQDGDLIMVVGASGIDFTSRRETFANFSNRGKKISVVAPGDDRTFFSIMGAEFGVELGGTSFAAPTVAGLAAAMLKLHRQVRLNDPLLGLSGNEREIKGQVVQAIEATADDFKPLGPSGDEDIEGHVLVELPGIPGDGWDRYCGFGRINAWKSLLSVVNGGLASENNGSADTSTNRRLEIRPVNGDSIVVARGPAIHSGGKQRGIVDSFEFIRVTGEGGGPRVVVDDPFPGIPRKQHAETHWYGFEIRATQVVDIFLAPAGGGLSKVVDDEHPAGELPFTVTSPNGSIPLTAPMADSDFVYKFTVEKSTVDGGSLVIRKKDGTEVLRRDNMNLVNIRRHTDVHIRFDDYVFIINAR